MSNEFHANPLNGLLLLKNGKVWRASKRDTEKADILLREGKIEQIGKPGNLPEGTTQIDLAGAVVFPGLIDMHVHLREPGFEEKETIETGCAAAAAGGFTAV
ncbi:amidohydrolase family protein, partial [candidate division KSB1 bacterium]